MDREEIENCLSALPQEAAAAFAVRGALRLLPFLAMSICDINSTTQANAESIFSFWPKNKRQMYLLALFRAQLHCIGFVGHLVEVDAAEFEIPLHALFSTYGSIEAYCAASAIAKALAISTTTDKVKAAQAASSVVSRIGTLFEKDDALLTWDQFEHDLKMLQVMGAMHLLQLPLWQARPPGVWQDKWELFATQLQQLDASFIVWLEWYKDCLAGNRIDFSRIAKWISLDPEIEGLSPCEINLFLASLPRAKHALNRVRTIFIGFGDAGKTSLIKALFKEEIVEGKEEITSGIEIREWLGAPNGIISHFWDFGGQVMAHAIHQLLFRSRCLYVLVLSSRAEIDATSQADYWLAHVQAYSAGAPVMIVGNKHDQTPVHLDMAALKAKYPNVQGFYDLSCTLATKKLNYLHKFQNFLTEFHQQLTTIDTHQVMFSDEQFNVLKELQQRSAKHPFLQLEEFISLCQQHKVEVGEDQDCENPYASLLDLLDKLGIIIHFKDLVGLSGHVLNPRWLTYGVYTIMYSHRPRLSLDDIISLLDKSSVIDEQGYPMPYPSEKCRLIVNAMLRFKLCYRMRGNDEEFIIPSLMEPAPPIESAVVRFNKADALAFKATFASIVPRHVLPEMIVERNDEIVVEENDEKIQKDLVWQYGVMLASCDSNTQARALLQVDYQARELTIWTHGRDNMVYLQDLRRELLRILKRLAIEPIEMIRLPRKALQETAPLLLESEDWAGYTQLFANLKRGKTSFISLKGWEYDLSEVTLFFGLDATVTGPEVKNPVQYNIYQFGTDGSTKNVNIIGSTLGGSATLVDQLHDSFHNS